MDHEHGLEGWEVELGQQANEVSSLDVLPGGEDRQVADAQSGEDELQQRVAVVGRYEIQLARQGPELRMSALRFLFQYQTGNTDLPTRAMQRAKA